ncbi:MAG: hypothetical protein KKF44_06530 [Nanoarchaeota archaeon]|nr:hypothetical protein [Nanoarchaeota archaeon]
MSDYCTTCTGCSASYSVNSATPRMNYSPSSTSVAASYTLSNFRVPSSYGQASTTVSPKYSGNYSVKSITSVGPPSANKDDENDIITVPQNKIEVIAPGRIRKDIPLEAIQRDEFMKKPELREHMPINEIERAIAGIQEIEIYEMLEEVTYKKRVRKRVIRMKEQ